MLQVTDDYTVTVDGIEVRVVIERGIVNLDQGSVLSDKATVSADHAGCGGLELEAAAGSYFFALGRQDALTGHTGFDDRYIVKTNDEAALRYWFGEREAEAVLATYDPNALDPYALTVDGERVALTASWQQEAPLTAMLKLRLSVNALRAAGPPLASGVDAAIDAVAMLAGRGARLADEWRARLEPLGVVEAGPVWRADDRYGITLERGRTRVRIDFPWRLHPLRRGGLRTRISIPWPDAGAAVVWPRTWSWRTRPSLARARDLDLARPWNGEARDAPALAALPFLGPSLTALGVDWLIAADGRLAVGWGRIVEDRDTLAAAATQLERWAERVAPSSGPYR